MIGDPESRQHRAINSTGTMVPCALSVRHLRAACGKIRVDDESCCSEGVMLIAGFKWRSKTGIRLSNGATGSDRLSAGHCA